MSLESETKDLGLLVKHLISAMEENTAALKASNAGRTAALNAASALKGTKSEKDEEPDDEKAKAPTKKTAAKKPAAKKTAAKKPPTAEELVAKFAAYMDVKDDEYDTDEEYEAAKDETIDFVQSLLKEFGAKKVSEIAAGDRTRAMKFIEKKMAGEEVDFKADDDDDGDGDEENDLL